MNKPATNQEFLDKLFAAGEKSLDKAFEISNIQTDALKKLGEQQAAIASAFIEFNNRQYEILSGSRHVESYIKAQTEAGNDLRSALVRYSEGLRGVGEDVCKHYADLAKEFTQAAAEGAKAAGLKPEAK